MRWKNKEEKKTLASWLLLLVAVLFMLWKAEMSYK
jgi:hypothetical protein